jgi:hypothetical protein
MKASSQNQLASSDRSTVFITTALMTAAAAAVAAAYVTK